MKHLVILMLTGVILLTGCSDGESASYFESEYTNPVFEPVLADPSIIRSENGIYYAYGTEDNWGDGMGNRIVPIVRSENLTDWKYVGEAFNEKPSWKEDGGIWAPDIAFYQDRYYLYYSQSVWGDSNPGIGVAVSDSPEGPFEDKGKLFDSEEIGVPNSIDPQFILDDGDPYLFWGSWHGIWGVALKEDGMDYRGEPFMIAGTAFEAPYIIKRDGEYVFFGSKGSCCEGQWSEYRVAVGKADDLKGPYLDINGVDLIKGTGTVILEGNDTFAGPGHNAVVQDDRGDDWMIYHGIDQDNPWIGSGTTRRPLMIDRIEWDENGWPTVHDGSPTAELQQGPAIAEPTNK